MSDCKCDMRTQLVGDGCEQCNPQMAIDLLRGEIACLRAEVERLRMTGDEREVLRLVAQQCAKRHWSDWAIVVDGVLARHGGE